MVNEEQIYYVKELPANCIDCSLPCLRGCKKNSDEIRKEYITKRPKNCPLRLLQDYMKGVTQ